MADTAVETTATAEVTAKVRFIQFFMVEMSCFKDFSNFVKLL